MALRALTALQAAFAGLGGGIEGAQMYRQQKEARKRQAMLDKRQNKATRLARELSVRSEQRQALDAGGLMADMDMPGAAPRTGVMRQTIGGQEFLFEPKDIREHREAVRKRREQGTQPDRLQWSDKYGGFVNLTTGKFVPTAGLPSVRSDERRLSPGQEQSIRDEEAEAEALFNTTMQRDSPLRQALVSAYNSLRTARPNARPQELMRAAAGAAQRMQAPLQGKAPPKLDDYEEMAAQVKKAQPQAAAKPPAPNWRVLTAPAAQPVGMSAQQEAEIARQMRKEGYDEAFIAQYLEELRSEYQ
jgi:hypothetical protein